MRYNNSRGSGFKGTVLAIGILAFSTFGIAPHCSRDTYQVKINGSERVVQSTEDGKSTSKYVIFTQDEDSGIERAFENTDSFAECLFSGCKFDSSTLQAKLKSAEKSGTTCNINTYGWRIPILSLYQNIIEANCNKQK